MTPAALTPADTDETIFAAMTARPERFFAPQLVRTRIKDGEQQAWSWRQQRWLTVTEYANEWRHAYRYRQVMGDEETVRALNRYERGLGL